ncbi:phosphoesterase [Heterostelium album PN500]|uniref:Phosphoesterase n=1 Tax=Heterostelium pallidum (strain ATCC 26659 / Pp 5 / PN500) TaxID=670386 RepID=D3BTK8_HETP5|nr:phosphoesterase [Heterostelium album PN500]EFA75425.1 phosphoesterase [Heterostelium album PN500]|eukprot:XP_020427559.1 phosphoesterase [Heterostelium album PN500]
MFNSGVKVISVSQLYKFSITIEGFSMKKRWEFHNQSNYNHRLLEISTTGKVVLGTGRSSATWDAQLLYGDSSILGWLFPFGQLGLFIDKSSSIGPDSFVGKLSTEIFQLSYISYYIWGYFMEVYVLFKLWQSYLSKDPEKNKEMPIWDQLLKMFICSWISTYFVVFSINLIFPAESPRVFINDKYTNALNGFGLAGFIRNKIESAAKGSFGSFPSGHIATSWAVAFASYKIVPLYGYISAFAAFLITIATMYLRYHYLVDFLAAIPVAFICLMFGGFYSLNDIKNLFIRAKNSIKRLFSKNKKFNHCIMSNNITSSSSSSLSTKNCYCDPTVPFGYDCSYYGCKSFAYLFFFFFLFATVGSVYRSVSHRNSKTLFISYFIQIIGNSMITIRHLMLIIEVREVYSLAILLIFGGTIIYSSFNWIQLYWCRALIIILPKESIHLKVVRILRWLLIAINVLLFLLLFIGFALWWPYVATNLLMVIYGITSSISYLYLLVLLYMRSRQIKKESPTIQSAHSPAPNINNSINKVMHYGASIVFTGALFAITLLILTFWTPNSDTQNVVWLYFSRVTLLLYCVAFLSFNAMDSTTSKTSSTTKLNINSHDDTKKIDNDHLKKNIVVKNEDIKLKSLNPEV